ncbi:helix-turn-helix transcriptional regulator [Lachnospiraceae bacterium Oil+RF-744-WCA-WT-13]|jgi:DNA-binding CsgD family transcriptional regulator|uniref:Helix-turn-helix transcriptional regulator n=2 Tax=Bilifractor porci TaxID=2606636 RepID=A0A7X2P9K7_9FIRM|nr:helix-turn-helix transcriptional regulator [Bilifractor porci]
MNCNASAHQKAFTSGPAIIWTQGYRLPAVWQGKEFIMEIAMFRTYNTMICGLYEQCDVESVKQELLGSLQKLIPYQYADVQVLYAGDPDLNDREPYLSELLFDELELKICHKDQPLAQVRLYRLRKKGKFTDAERFLLRSMEPHLEQIFYRHLCRDTSQEIVDHAITRINSQVHLTPREREVLEMMFRGDANSCICDALHITEHTLQKHLQNLYRKLHISSRWELVGYLTA